MSPNDRARPALRAAVAALAPALRIKSSKIDQLVEQLIGGIAQDSFGTFWLNSTGKDMAQFVQEDVTRTNPEYFESYGRGPPTERPAPAAKPTIDRRNAAERRAAATAALGAINGDKGPRL